MPNYAYKAIDDRGKLQRGKVIAFGAKDAEDRIRKDGLTLIDAKKLKERHLGSAFQMGGVKTRLRIELYRRLAQTLELGLPIVAAVEENAKLLPSKMLKRVLDEVRVSIESGKSLYEAMRRFPRVFQRLDLGIINMGEQTGVVPQCLKDLADFHEWKDDIRSMIKKATIYPAFIIIALVAVIGVWVGYVLPEMAVLLKEMSVAIPDITQTILSLSLFIQTNWPWLIGMVVLGVVCLWGLQRTHKGGIEIQRILIRVPVIGKVISNIALARLCHYFATMYGAGMSINAIFEILTDSVLGNKYYEARVKAAYNEVQLGQNIAASFKKAGGFPLLLLGGIKNGETTGTLDDAFKRLGDFYDNEVKRSVQAMVSTIEPMTIILLGGVFGLIILSILLPLYDVIGQVGKVY